MELTEPMEEMVMMQKMCPLHQQSPVPLVLKVSAAKKVLTVLQDQAVQQVWLEPQVQLVQVDQQVQLVLRVVVLRELRDRQVQIEQTERMAAQAVPV
jgi:hypothetical protein